MQRLIEILLGLDRGFLGREGDFALAFNPQWPLGATEVWNVLLALVAVGLVFYVYRREGHSKVTRIVLAGLRLSLIPLTLVLLNRPTITLTQSRVEPSVLAIAIDDSLSMRVSDVGGGDHPE